MKLYIHIYVYICIYIHTHMHTYTHMYVCTDIGKDNSAGKDWGQKEKGETEDEMVGWHHQLNGQEFERALGDGEGTGKPGMLSSMGSQRVGRDLATEQQ